MPYTAGTAADAVARFIAAKLTALWGTTVLVENKAGADGVVGTRAVLQAPADGHMVLFTGPPFLYNTEMLQTAPYVPLRDSRWRASPARCGCSPPAGRRRSPTWPN